MMNQELTFNFQQAMNDQNFVNLLAGAQTAEEAQKIFASRNIVFSLDEVKALGAALRSHTENGEIDDKLLAQISGGVAITTVAACFSIAAGAVTVVDFIGKRCKWWK